MWRKLLRSRPVNSIISRDPILLKSVYLPQSPISNAFSRFHAREETRVSNTLTYPLLFGGYNFCSSSSQKLNCWNCNAVAESTTPFLYCQSCRSVQPVDQSIDYFSIFGLEKKFDIDVSSLEGKYKEWQKKLHPDLVHSKSEEEKEYAAEQSARVIDSYRTLTDPLSRAMYIMRLAGVEVDEEQTVSEPELLSEIMEIREAVEEAADAQALNEIQTQMQQKLIQWGQSLADAFQKKNYDEAQKSIQRMTYYKRVNEEIIKRL